MAFLNFTTEQKYSIEIIIILIEFGLIGFLIFMTISLKLLYRTIEKTDDILSKLIESIILRLIYQKKNFKQLKYPVIWRRLNILVPLIHKIDKEHSGVHWVNVRTKIVDEIILPQARVMASSIDIRKRVIAAEAFCLMSQRDPANEEPILKLVNSKIPFVSLNGIYAALVYGSEKMIDAIICCLAEQPWMFSLSNLKLFQSYLESKGNFVENKLKSSSDKSIRMVCYNILTQCKPIKITWDVSRDFFSSNMELKISALKFVAHCDREMAISPLIRALDDEVLEVKLVAIDRIRLLRVIESIPYLEKKLKDEELWVRLSAAQALADLGVDKEKLAQDLNMEIGKIFINIPYTKTLWW